MPIPELIKEMSERLKKIRNIRTPKELIEERKGARGEMWKYVKRITIQRWLDEHYCYWNWEFDSLTLREYLGYYQGSGLLSVWDPIINRERKIKTMGSIIIMLDSETKEVINKEYAKSVDTDALKRAVFTLGGFTDVYTDEEITGANEISEKENFVILELLPAIYFPNAESPQIGIAQNAISGYLKGVISTKTVKEIFKIKD